MAELENIVGLSKESIQYQLQEKFLGRFRIDHWEKIPPWSLPYWQTYRWRCFYSLNSTKMSNQTLDILTTRHEQIKNVTPNISQEFKSLKKEIRQLGYKIDRTLEAPEVVGGLQWVSRFMNKNAFSQDCTYDVLQFLRKNLNVDEIENSRQVEQTTLLWIFQRIKFSSTLKGRGNKLILIGPSGVGKTTTIGKIGAKYFVKNQSTDKKVVSISYQDGRIGAKEQSTIYAETLDMIFYKIEKKEQLNSIFSQEKKSDLFLIDTFSDDIVSNTSLVELWQPLFDTCGEKKQIMLVLSAAAKVEDLDHIITQTKKLPFDGIILTKLDETLTLGSCLSVFMKHSLPICFLTTGRNVPGDLLEASAEEFIKRLQGIRLDENSLTQVLEKCKISFKKARGN